MEAVEEGHARREEVRECEEQRADKDVRTWKYEKSTLVLKVAAPNPGTDFYARRRAAEVLSRLAKKIRRKLARGAFSQWKGGAAREEKRAQERKLFKRVLDNVLKRTEALALTKWKEEAFAYGLRKEREAWKERMHIAAGKILMGASARLEGRVTEWAWGLFKVKTVGARGQLARMVLKSAADVRFARLKKGWGRLRKYFDISRRELVYNAAMAGDFRAGGR